MVSLLLFVVCGLCSCVLFVLRHALRDIQGYARHGLRDPLQEAPGAPRSRQEAPENPGPCPGPRTPDPGPWSTRPRARTPDARPRTPETGNPKPPNPRPYRGAAKAQYRTGRIDLFNLFLENDLDRARVCSVCA